MYELQPIRIELPDGSIMRGWGYTGPDVERIELRHEMADGSFASEVLYRAVEQAPPPPVSQDEPAAAAEAEQ